MLTGLLFKKKQDREIEGNQCNHKKVFLLKNEIFTIKVALGILINIEIKISYRYFP